jgi:predicted exporter
VFVDMKSEFDTLYQGYLSEAVSLSLAGFVAIVGLLAFSLRSARRLARVLLTLVLTVAIVIAGLHLIGERLHLLHLVGMLLIVAVGSNYALFFDRAAGGEPLDAEILLSMAVAALTTTIGFGALALSSVPVLNAVGVTVGPGALLAILLSAVLVYPARAR